MLKKIITVLIFIPLIAAQLCASGFLIYEQGAKSAALSGATIAAANDLSAIFYNPAGVTQLDGIRVSVGATAINTVFAFAGPSEIDEKQYSRAQEKQILPSHLYISYKYNNWLSAGFGYFSSFGYASAWSGTNEPWIGRDLSITSELNTHFYNPMIALKPLDNLSVGVGINFVSANIIREKSVLFISRNVYGISGLDADGNGLGFNMGIQYKPFKKFTLGMNYRGNMTLDFKNGDVAFDFPASGNDVIDQEILDTYPQETSASFKTELPYLLGFGVAYDFTENLLFEFDYLQFGWSGNKEYVVSYGEAVDGQEQETIAQHYKDSYSLRFGMEYRVDASLALRIGYAWDQQMVQDAYLNPSLPEGNRHNYSIGFGYNLAGFTVDGFYLVMLQDDREITNSVNGFNGEYSGLGTLYGLTLGFAF